MLNSRTDRTSTLCHTMSLAALFAYGFRPFFLLAGIYAMLAVPLWIALLYGVAPQQPALPLPGWHAHEMLYGFVTAAIAGFLLTAVPSWTNRRGYAGAPLACLVAVWLLGRIVMTVPLGLPTWISAAIDLSFLPLLGLTILPALLRSGNRRNLVFLALITLLFVSNLQFHLNGALDITPLMLGFNVMLFMLALLGARMLPAFTSSGLKQRGIDIRIQRNPLLEKLVLIALAGVLLIDLAGTDTIDFVEGGLDGTDTLLPGFDGTHTLLPGLAAMLAAVLLLAQLSRWHGHRTFRDPIIWILHLGYLWLPLCLGVKAAWLLGASFPGSIWLHALSMGAMSSMIIGVMSRASLGHTGRKLEVSRSVVAAYCLLTGAAISRVFGPILLPAVAGYWPLLAAMLWTLAFSLFVLAYAPILSRPRADGRAG